MTIQNLSMSYSQVLESVGTKISGWADQLRVSIFVMSVVSFTEYGKALASTASTMPHDLHRNRRAAFSPYFSKANIRRLEPVIMETLDNLLHRLDASAKSGRVMPLSRAYQALTSDVITAYCFGESTGFLMREDYNSPLFEAVIKFFALAWWMTHIAWLGPLVNSVPINVQIMLLPGLESIFRMQRVSTCTSAKNSA